MAAKVLYYVACSLDGHIAAADGGVGWLDQFDSGDAADYGYREFFDSIDRLVMGRTTYEQALGFGDWPYREKACTVFSSRPLERPPWGVERFTGAPREWIGSTDLDSDDRVWLVGGGRLASSFAAADLIDEYVVFQMPCVLGRGVPLLGAQGAKLSGDLQKLSVLECDRYPNGVVKLHYRKTPATEMAEPDVR